MNVHVHRSRDLGDSLTEFFSDLVILWIMAHHLNVNRRGKTRVKNLADDVSRHAEKCVVGVLGYQLFADLLQIIKGWSMIRRVQRNVDLTVSGTDRRRVAQGQIEIHWQSNVFGDQFNLVLWYHVPDHIFNLVEYLLRLFDAGANRGTNVEAELAGVYFWEKIFAKKWRHDNQREHHDRHHYPDHETCVVKRPLQPRGVKVSQLLEPTVKSFVDAEEPISGWRLEFIRILLVVLILEQEIHHGWNDRAGQKVGSQHGKDDGHR